MTNKKELTALQRVTMKRYIPIAGTFALFFGGINIIAAKVTGVTPMSSMFHEAQFAAMVFFMFLSCLLMFPPINGDADEVRKEEPGEEHLT